MHTSQSKQPLSDTLSQIIDGNVTRDVALTLSAQTIDNGLFTAMRFHEDDMEVERLFSTLSDVYPVSGRKPKRDTEWGEKVLIRREINLGFGPEDITWAFGDHETILELGLQAVLNVPVVRGETVLGTINFLRADKPFSEVETATGQLLAAALALRGLHA
ncbi:GAF domain-containing protein [Roseibium sp. CAU 1637]|uniref:GAF domain-containing protein n=1 Tax=Roseibium limicola TaxID=2816037 RepID=A0A939J5E3_9HYPH|nr:GAF domain-containing protein [Roseibium limicola]MBO0345725.1 GAF domain-containing protein [Roseibium limicola]